MPLTCIPRLQLAHEDYYLLYAPPEYCNSMTSNTLRSLGPKGDVYSFGVVSCYSSDVHSWPPLGCEGGVGHFVSHADPWPH